MSNDIPTPPQQEPKEPVTWHERLAIWDLSGEQKSEIAETIISDVSTSVEYRSLMFLSAIIATLGLLINATPVVIGAMIIAPIMRPIQAVSFATTTGNRTLFFKSLLLLLLSTVGSIIFAILVTQLIPFTQVTNEIAMRIQPTLIDLVIAFASGIVAFLAFGYKRITTTLAGVAMAASLLPPLCVIGIGIAFGSWSIGRGSTLLFLTNLMAIIIAGIGIFYLFGFFPTAKSSLRRSIINSVSAIIMLVLLSIPLGSSLVQIASDIRTKETIDTATDQFFSEINEEIELQTMRYRQIPGGKTISLTLRVPQNQISKITDTHRQALTKALSAELNENVELEVTLVPITSVYVQPRERANRQEQLQRTTQQFLDALYRPVYLLQVDYFENQKNILIGTFYTEEFFEKVLFAEQFEEYIKEHHPDVDTVITNRETQATENIPPSLHQQQLQSITASFSNFFPDSTLHKITLREQEETWAIELRTSTPYTPQEF